MSDLYIMKEDPSMNHSEFETEKMHYLELLRLLDACNPHLIALGYPPFDSSYEESEPDETNCGDCDSCSDCPSCGNCAACGTCREADDHPCPVFKMPEALSTEDYVVLTAEDFKLLMNDCHSLYKTVLFLYDQHRTKEYLSNSLTHLAVKLKTSAEESEKINQVIQSARESMNHWDNMELTPISQI